MILTSAALTFWRTNMALDDWVKLLSGKPPTSQQVKKIHENADTDGSQKSIHHTLGPLHNQSAPGDHTHDGGTSARLLEGVTLTGSRTNITTLGPQIVAALEALGATNNTTP